MVDLFITLLSMGIRGHKKLLEDRKALKSLLTQRMEGVAEKYGLRVLNTKNNPISIGE